MAKPKNSQVKYLQHYYKVINRSAHEWIRDLKANGIEVPTDITTPLPDKLANFIAAHKRVARTDATLIPVLASLSGSNIIPETETGAAASLARVEKFELYYANKLIEAQQQGDRSLEAICQKQFSEYAELVRKLDIAVEESRRSAGQQIPKEQILKLINRFVIASYVALKKSKQAIVPELASLTDNTKIDKLLDDTLGFVWIDGIKSMLGSDIPEWLSLAITEEMKRVTLE